MYLYTTEQNFRIKILYLGVDFKQNVGFLPSLYAAKSISLHKKSA